MNSINDPQSVLRMSDGTAIRAGDYDYALGILKKARRISNHQLAFRVLTEEECRGLDAAQEMADELRTKAAEFIQRKSVPLPPEDQAKIDRYKPLTDNSVNFFERS